MKKLVIMENGIEMAVVATVRSNRSMSVDEMLQPVDWETWQADNGFDPEDDNYSLLQVVEA